MNALVPAAPGDSPALVLSEVDDPEPRPDELVVSVAAFSVNRGETFLLEHPNPGWRPGKDVAGVVTRAADNGHGPSAGTRVVAHPESGGWAESVAVETARVATLPDAKGPFDIGLDSIGGPSTAAVLRKLREHGLLIWFGQASRVAPTLDLFDWSGGSSATIRKFSYTDSTICDGDDLATLVHLVATGRLHPEIGLIAGWTETNDVIRALVARRVRDNAVVTLRAA